MKKRYNFLFVLLLALLGFSTIFLVEVLAACFPDLPAPVLQFQGTEHFEVGGTEFTRYKLAVENGAAYPEELFSPAPQLPPCGSNANASRTWIDIVDDRGGRINGFCALSSPDNLAQLWFAIPRGEEAPSHVHSTFRDRECNQTFLSNSVSTSPAYIRQNISEFAQDPDKLAALRRGIEVIKGRSATDPTSWAYQGNIHGDPGVDGPAQPAWNSCQHGSWYFLAWHRMYLYYFERILRQASGDPTFALPYWNYSDTSDPNARQLPLPYREPADPTGNPLFLINRSSSMNAGGLLPLSAVDIEQAFLLTMFSSPAGDGQSFGGQRSGPGHSLGPHSIFEGTPHDVVHVNIGGWMGSFERAARDPVFWLHHANIDRLWEAWLSQGEGRSNPTSGQGDPWLTQTFTFFDENGATVTITGAQIVDTVRQLNYRYDGQISPEGRALRQMEFPPMDKDRMFRLAESKQLVKKELEDFLLKGDQRSVTVPLPAEASRFTQGNLTLHLENVNVQTLPTGHYEIYINLPENEKPNYQSDYFVGNMSFFGSAQPKKQASRSFSFSLVNLEKKLRKTEKWTNEITVTFVKTGPVPPPGQDVLRRAEDQGVVQIGAIKINRE